MQIEQELKLLIKNAVHEFVKKKGLALKAMPEPVIEHPRAEGHGDYATNVAMVLASLLGMKPREIAEGLKITLSSQADSAIKSVEVAGPGFINFVINKKYYLALLHEIFQAGENYGKLGMGRACRVQIEFVSANPTGPLHIGHGRGAVYGDALASVLETAGYEVTREYYLNDAGNQMAMLGRSVYLRIQEIEGKAIEFPEEGYQGAYLIEIAHEIKASKAYSKFKKKTEKEQEMECSKLAAAILLKKIKADLKSCGIKFDRYFSEYSLYDGEVPMTLELLRKKGCLYEKEGAMWFRSSQFGDEKDRVLRKQTGELTYFATDIAYHRHKFAEGYDRVIDVWGADHDGHIKRMKASMEALGLDPKKLEIVILQLVNLMHGDEAVSMSKRTATYETFRSLVNDVGRDVCRYFFLMRAPTTQLDFDIELARKESPENPVYYIQYAHARIASIFRKAEEEGYYLKESTVSLDSLNLDEEAEMARILLEFPSVIKHAAAALEPHKLSFYLLDLARMFQSYYSQAKHDERYKVIEGSTERVLAKLYLLKNIQIVLKNGLTILGISVPEKM